MNWLSTMKTGANLAASACGARAMYQRMSTLASPGISGSSQVWCWPGPPTPIRTAPSISFLLVAMPEVSAAASPRVQREIVMSSHYAASLIPSILIGMTRDLGIGPLRSFVAVADCGGFQRAATALHLTQGAVSQHVRRLESALGRALVERDGRGSRFTADGETLLARARRVFAGAHETLAAFAVEDEPRLTIGSTEHAADHLLPALAAAFP